PPATPTADSSTSEGAAALAAADTSAQPAVAAAGSQGTDAVAGLDATSLRSVLRRAAEKKAYPLGAQALLGLASVDPGSFARADVVEAAAAVAVGIAFGDSRAADPVFEVLSQRLGGAGADVLYEVMSRY